MLDQLFGTSIGLIALMGLVLTLIVGIWVHVYVIAKVFKADEEGGEDGNRSRDSS